LALAWISVRLLPARLAPATGRRGARFGWAAPALPALAALLPILPAAWLSAYIVGASISLPALPGGATAVAQLPETGLAALGGANGKVRVLDLRAGPPFTQSDIDTGEHAVSSLALRAEEDSAADARVVLAVSTADGRVHLFDARRGSRLPLPEPFASLQGSGSKVHVGLGPGAALAAAVEMPAGEVRLVSAGGALDIEKHGPVTALQWLAKDLVAFATLDGTIDLARLPAGKLEGAALDR
jgi:WD40 repeat protein